MQFDLLINPFAILGLAGDAGVGIITARARELATADAATVSRQLLVPRTRLHAELSHLPGAPQELVNATIEALKIGRKPDLRPLAPLARANVLAHLASREMATADQLRDLVGLQKAIRSTAGELIRTAHERAKLPPVSEETATLETISSQHAEAFTLGMLAISTGASVFTELLRAVAPDASVRTSFLRQSASAWDRATAKGAAQDLESAAPIEATLRDHPNPESAEQLATIVLRFANRTSPAREALRLFGLSHETSIDAAQRWRSVALDLNNRQDAVVEAVTVLQALADGFGTRDELGSRTARDLEICRERLAAGEGNARNTTPRRGH